MKLKKIRKIFLIILLVFSWLFSSRPVLWQNPRIPPEIKKAKASAAYDAVSESHTGTTGSASQDSFSWTHTPVQTPRGVLVFVNTIGSSDLSTSVTYGGVSMNRVSGSTATDSAGEPGTVTAWFLGSGIPTGAQTVTVNRTNNATVMYAVCITITGESDTTIVGTPVLLQGDGTYAVQAVDSGSQTVQRFAAGYSGGGSVLAAGTGSTSTGASGQIDYGNYTFTTVYETANGFGSRNIGFNYATTDDRAAVHLAVADVDTETVNYDAVSESHTGTTGSASQDSFSWTHTPVQTPRGVLVFVNTIGSSDLSTSVTYGGVSMNRVSGSTATDSAGEPGTVTAWFLGSGIPTGAQTVIVNRTNNATVMYAVCITVTTLDSDTEVVGTPVLLQGDGTYTVQAVDSGSRPSRRFAAGYSGGGSVLVAGTGSTSTGASGQIDYGNYTFTTVFEKGRGSGSRDVGFSYATTEDRAAVHLAVAATVNNPPSLTVSQPDGTEDTIYVGQSYNITYTLSDAEDIATVDFYYDANDSGLDGTAITGCQDQGEGEGVTCSWNTTGMTPGSYYVYGIATDGINDSVNDYSSGVITIQAVSISITVFDGNVAYGMMAKNSSKTTLSSDMPPSGDMQTINYDTNVSVNINIKGYDASGGGCTWTLASSNGNDQYVHQFCNETDGNCSSPPTSYTALTTGYQTLKSGVSGVGSVDFHLRLTTPTESSCYGQQSVNVTVQAVQP